MKQQEIKKIKLSELVLWTENPRDPINENAKNQDIANKALADPFLRWTLRKLAKEMGSYYDFSELPTVVYHGETPVVYDGNRRIILGLISKGIIKYKGSSKLKLPDFPEEIPCNVCPKEVALNNILRKHGDSGSWMPLERDIFLHKHMGQKKSLFLIIEEKTHLITAEPHLNKGFVKKEIFIPEKLEKLGFQIKEGVLTSTHTDDDAQKILMDISRKILNKQITTRKSRGVLGSVLDPSIKAIVDRDLKKKPRVLNLRFNVSTRGGDWDSARKSRRTETKDILFGGPLSLVRGDVNNLYRDIDALYKFYESNKLSKSFTALIRMSMRLLCETAAGGQDKRDVFLNTNFENAKNNLNQNLKTTLSTHDISKETILKLLHTGAHNYTASQNVEQTVAISIILGAILKITHGKPAK